MTAAESRPHYPAPVRVLVDLFRSGQLPQVADVEVEPEYGYAARVRYRDGAVRMVRGHDLGVNPAAASQIAKDKGYTKHFLERGGFDCPAGQSFVLPWWAARIGPRLHALAGPPPRLAAQAPAYARDELGYPVYAKPADGSKGMGVHRCGDDADLCRALAEYEQERVRVAIVEQAVALPDFRLVVLWGSLVAAYRRVPPHVVGDGEHSVAGLLAVTVAQLRDAGREATLDPTDLRVTRRLARDGLDFGSVPQAGQVVPLLDISNLSAGGNATELTGVVAPRWAALAIEIARHLGLDFCGVDLACADLTTDAGAYRILEVNAEPGLDNYGAIGAQQGAAVRTLYATIFATPPGRAVR